LFIRLFDPRKDVVTTNKNFKTTKKQLLLNEIILPPIVQVGRGLSHCPPTHFSLFAPTSSPFSHFTVATVPSVKSASLNVTVAFFIAFSMFQQLTLGR